MLGGLVKTLQHPVYVGIMSPADDTTLLRQLQVPRISIVAVNLYDLEAAKEKHGEEWRMVLLHGMDIGGPAMLRAAVKSECSTPVIDPDDYDRVLQAMAENNGFVPLALKLELSMKTMDRISQYDAQLRDYVASVHGRLTTPS
jgi:phosphoribosylaminoimidazolecarboxamide formyltransferase / IMP cyclohydrolase